MNRPSRGGNEFSELERALRASRAEPRDAFVRSLSQRLRRREARGASPRLRFGLATGLTAALLVPFAAFGGLGYAASGVTKAAKGVAKIAAPAPKKVTPPPPKKVTPPPAPPKTATLPPPPVTPPPAPATSAVKTTGGVSPASHQYPTQPQKVTICHRPPGSPTNSKTQVISSNALPAHLAHGDTVGSC